MFFPVMLRLLRRRQRLSAAKPQLQELWQMQSQEFRTLPRGVHLAAQSP